MRRYNLITRKNPREIVLLKGYPCAWGKCTFCDYTSDNSRDEEEMTRINAQVLSQVSGKTGVLEVINSGSCFELPKDTLYRIRQVIKEKNIHRLFLESHWIYRNRLHEMREFMGIPITFKIGVETFDNEFREKVLNKHASFRTPEEVARYFDSPCIMVCIKGQTKEMIDNDIRILKKYFRLGTINVFTNNSTSIQQDPKLLEWFKNKYAYLDDDPSIEVLYENTDFGVGE
jgi:radical SAM enzyme (TIGR01210 family)